MYLENNNISMLVQSADQLKTIKAEGISHFNICNEHELIINEMKNFWSDYTS